MIPSNRGSVMIALISQLCDTAKRLELQRLAPNEPTFTFLAILRNAIAHGGRFTFNRHQRTKYLPITLGEVTLTEHHEDEPWVDVLGPGDVWDLLERMRVAVVGVLP